MFNQITSELLWLRRLYDYPRANEINPQDNDQVLSAKQSKAKQLFIFMGYTVSSYVDAFRCKYETMFQKHEWKLAIS